MNTIDKLNHRYGLKSIKLAVEGADKEAWHSRSEHRSGNYISDINEIMTIRI
jgi:DNA polymerase V